MHAPDVTLQVPWTAPLPHNWTHPAPTTPAWLIATIGTVVVVGMVLTVLIGAVVHAVDGRKTTKAARPARERSTARDTAAREAAGLRKSARTALKRAQRAMAQGSVTDAQNLEWEAETFTLAADRIEAQIAAGEPVTL